MSDTFSTTVVESDKVEEDSIVTRQLGGQYTVSVALLVPGPPVIRRPTTEGGGVEKIRLTAREVESGNLYRVEASAASLSDINGGSFRNMGRLYSFLAESLSVTVVAVRQGGATRPSPCTDDDPPLASLSSFLWKCESSGDVLYEAHLVPEHSYFDPISVTLRLGLAREGTVEERHSFQMAKLTEQFQRANEENTRRFQNDLDGLSMTVDLLKRQLNGRVFVRGATLAVDVVTVVVGDVAYPSSTVNLTATTGDGSHHQEEAVDKALVRHDHSVSVRGEAVHFRSLCSPLLPILKAVARRVDDLGLLAAGRVPEGVTSDELMALTLCRNITYLDLSRAKVSHLDFLPALTKLTTLILKDADAVSDLGSLRGLTDLHTLDLTACKGVADVSVLNDLPSLRSVTLKRTSVVNSQTLTNPQLHVVVGQ
jgi:hypothetical protein